MAESLIKFRASHVFIRLAAVASLFHFVLGSYSPRYYEATRFVDSDVELLFGLLLIGSTLILPLLVGLELLWLYAGTAGGAFKRERNSIIVDGCFAAVWCVAAWGLLIYAVFHFVPL